ncbi:hypothetical protein CANINC_001610 [Pichia inconspicua]|uniref:Uncharacterized protein n=1 Tax=Pichia inconspicua TaxID=52247 RepID=A0A4T0X3K8_9ASCO|nr:hypothetical protein CANINC_001610 [[Candida] inconspicua]
MSKGHKKNPSTTTPTAGSTATPAATIDNHHAGIPSNSNSNSKSILRVYLDSITSALLYTVRTTTSTILCAYNTAIAKIKANPRRTYNYILFAIHVTVAAIIYSDRHNNTVRFQLGRHYWIFPNNREFYAPLAAASATLITAGNYFLEK